MFGGNMTQALGEQQGGFQKKKKKDIKTNTMTNSIGVSYGQSPK